MHVLISTKFPCYNGYQQFSLHILYPVQEPLLCKFTCVYSIIRYIIEVGQNYHTINIDNLCMPEGEQNALLLKRVLVYKKSFRTKYFQVIERERERERERDNVYFTVFIFTEQCRYFVVFRTISNRERGTWNETRKGIM